MAVTPTKNKYYTNSVIKCLTPQPQAISRNEINEIVNFGGGTLHRSFSYQHIWTQSSPECNNPSFTTRVTHSSVLYPDQEATSKFIEPTRKRKPKRDDMPSKRPKQASTSNTRNSLPRISMGSVHIFLWITTIGSGLLVYFLKQSTSGSNSIWPISSVKSDLKDALFDQDAAIEKLAIGVDYAMQTEIPTILVMTGSVGVGKTTAASVLQATFPWPSKISLFTADEFLKVELPPIGREPGWQLLVIDDCCNDPRPVANNLAYMIAKAKKNEAKLLAVLIYTYRTINELHEFLNSLQKLHFYHVPFEGLSKATVKKCLLKELHNNGIYSINENLVDKLVKDQMAFIKEVGSTPGCKLIDTKVVQYKSELERSHEEL